MIVGALATWRRRRDRHQRPRASGIVPGLLQLQQLARASLRCDLSSAPTAGLRIVLRLAREPTAGLSIGRARKPLTDGRRAEPHVMKTYGRLPIALSHGRGCWVWDTEGKQVPRRAGRHRRQHARPRPPEAGAGAAGPGRQADPQLELLPRAAAGAAGRQAVRAVGPDQRVLLQHRASRPTRRRSRSRASSATTRASSARRSSSTRRPSTAARSPRSRPPATPRCRPASARWSKASCGCR